MMRFRRNSVNSAYVFAGVMCAALAVRWIFFTGFLGTDEINYTVQGLHNSQGVWRSSGYIGDVRLGINFPVGLALWLFGTSEFVANLWSLLCSLGEVALVFLIAQRFWGLQAAVLSALLLAFTPLHAHFAGRLMADAPLGFFITLSFYSLFRGDLDESWRWHLAAGVAAGFVWRIKSHVALLYVLVFAGYLLWEKRIAAKWFLMGAGFVGMVALNSLIFLVMQGDFWHVVRMTTSGGADYAQQQWMKTSPGFYLYYLMVDVRHTWLLGPLALLGLIASMRSGTRDDGLIRVAIWGTGLLAVFSLFVLSLTPLTFIPKQTNYMLMFLAPLALLGGYALSRLPHAVMLGAAGLIVMLGFLGTGVEQQAIRSFVANSKPTQAYLASAPDPQYVYGMTNAVRYGIYERIFAAEPDKAPVIRNLKYLADDLKLLQIKGADQRGFVAYAVVDWQTADWGNHGAYRTAADLPACWQPVATLTPETTGAGISLVAMAIRFVELFPTNPRLMDKLEALIQPKPAIVYGIPPACGDDAIQP